MKRALLVSVFAAIALSASSAVPARAAEASWEDPAGDATAVGAEHTVAAEASPRPSDPELDARTVAFTVQGDSIVVTAKMEAGGVAAASGGSVWRFFFTHKEDRYYFQATAASAEYSQLFTSTPGFYRVNPDDPDPTSNGEELRCDCKMTVKLDEGAVQFVIKTAAVAKPLKVAPGAIELTNLELRTFRRVQFYVLSDVAPAPEPLKFRA